jgi:hypothetical protein
MQKHSHNHDLDHDHDYLDLSEEEEILYEYSLIIEDYSNIYDGV